MVNNRVWEAMEVGKTAEANSPKVSTWQGLLVDLFYCRGPPSADDDDLTARPETSSRGMRRNPSASPLGDISETDASVHDTSMSLDAVDVCLEASPEPHMRRPSGSAGHGGDKNNTAHATRKLSHRRSWSWSMQWQAAGERSSKARKRDESGLRGKQAPAEANDEGDGFHDLFDSVESGVGDANGDENGDANVENTKDKTDPMRPSSPSLDTDTSVASKRSSHSRNGSWSDPASWFGGGKTLEEREEAKKIKEENKRLKKRELEDAEALRVRASAENDQFERVMEESKKAHQYSLPRMRSRSDDAAACVLVTPPPRRRVGDVGDVGDNTGDVWDDGDELSTPSTKTHSSPPPTLSREMSTARANAGEWVEVELRGMPSRAMEASSSDKSSISGEFMIDKISTRKIRASAFFASLDQRSAGGEGACTLCCVALAEWLAANPGRLPTETLPDELSVSGGESNANAEDVDDADEDIEEKTDDATLGNASPPRTPTHTPDGSRGALVSSPMVTIGDTVNNERRKSMGQRPLPPKPKFIIDALISGAAREWRTLCQDELLVAKFPDKHFDLDTAAGLHTPFTVAGEVLRTEGREDKKVNSSSGHDEKNKKLYRASIHHGGSFVGFLRPPGIAVGDSPVLDMLADAAPPLEQIIQELRQQSPATFAVSWNDHFFTLHFRLEKSIGSSDSNNSSSKESIVAYVIDSLGERLCEGCRRGYVLRFDEESLMGVGDEGDGDAWDTTEGDKNEKNSKKTSQCNVASAVAAFVGDVLPSRALRDVSCSISAFANGDRNAVEPDPETLMRRLQIEFNKVETTTID